MAAWRGGTDGEALLALRLERTEATGVRMLHRRRVEGLPLPIDHVAVTPAGVHVIDAQSFVGVPRIEGPRGLGASAARRLVVGSRDCTPLVDTLGERVRAVRSVLDDAGLDGVPVHPVLCLVEARWPVFGGLLRIDGVLVLSVRRLLVRLRSGRDLDPGVLTRAHDVLATTLLPA